MSFDCRVMYMFQEKVCLDNIDLFVNLTTGFLLFFVVSTCSLFGLCSGRILRCHLTDLAVRYEGETSSDHRVETWKNINNKKDTNARISQQY